MPATWSASRTTARCAIGDTLTEGEDINFVGVPNFAPEILRRVRLPDAMKAKKLKEALQQLAEEGVVQVFRPQDGSPALVGVVGPLQLDVLQVRLKDEYGLEVMWDTAEFALARWIASDDPKALDEVRQRPTGSASPTISTAIRCFSRATSSISTTPASARPASSSPTSRTATPTRRLNAQRSSSKRTLALKSPNENGLPIISTPASSRP